MVIVYDKDTGRIAYVINGPLRPEVEQFYRKQKGVDCIFCWQGLDAEHLARDYYVRKRLCKRPSFDVPAQKVQLQTDESLSLKLPKGCDVTIDGETMICDDGKLVLEADAPDRFEVELTHWPYRDAAFVVEVMA